MTDTPITPDRDPSRREELLFMLLHGGARDETIAQRVVDLALAEARAEMKAEVDRLRKTLSDATGQIAELEGAALCPSRVATPLGTPRTSECALPVRHQGDHRNAAKNHYWGDEYAEGAAELEAMRRNHPAPCRVPDSPDCTCPLTPEQALRIERDRPETRTTHDCTLPLVRRLDCGHCPHEVCQDCDRCPHTCECTP
ncbi:hypothetical protein [Streptomyces anulatus]|uniref:hypothetical protein n=1 Tax=Streptomyces anulatus TaxID=1892 RepID=UPI0032461A38